MKMMIYGGKCGKKKVNLFGHIVFPITTSIFLIFFPMVSLYSNEMYDNKMGRVVVFHRPYLSTGCGKSPGKKIWEGKSFESSAKAWWRRKKNQWGKVDFFHNL